MKILLAFSVCFSQLLPLVAQERVDKITDSKMRSEEMAPRFAKEQMPAPVKVREF